MPNSKKDNSILKLKEDEIRSLNSRIKQTAHDLNNIITSSKNSIAAIKQQIKPDDKILKYLTNLETNSIREAEIIEELLASEGIGERNKRRINVNDLIDDVVRTLKGSINGNVELIINVKNDLFKIDGFYSDLYRAFLNLSINSFEAIEKKGKIIFGAKNVISRINGKAIRISIKDTGCGINEKSLKSIFKDGYSTKNKKVTAGLGLYIVKNIVEEHGGNISVKSKEVKGAEFVVVLPAVKSVIENAKKNKIKKILIAEDEAPILESISYLLESYNYETICASNGSIALEKYEANESIDMMIIDNMMPGLNGIDVIKKIRINDKVVPIVLTTGLQDADELKFSKLGINKVLKKPYDFDLLIELIRGTSL